MVLIVDDKEENLLSLRSILQLNKIEVDTASSGEEALQKVLKTYYALIILDVQMPGMDGFEVAEAITGYSKTKDIPIIFLSAANTHKKFITKGYESGAIDYVTKPVDADILLFKVKTFQRLYDQKNELSTIQNALREEIAIRQKAEETLNDNVRELHSIIEAIPQIAFTAKPDGTIEFVNEHWFRYSANIKEFPEVPEGDATIRSVWQDAIAEAKPLEMEVCIRMLERGDYRYHLLRALPVKDTQNNITKWVGTLTDIQEQKQINQLLEQKVEERTLELQQSNEELEAKNHELQQFTSVASHDLKEPLRKIQVFSSIVREKLEANDYHNLEEYLRRIIVSGERMSGLINDLLSYSRLSVLSLFENADLNKIVQNILLDLEIAIVEKDAVVEVDDLPVVQAIPGQIRQLLQNILSNALKFSKAGVPPVIGIRCSIISEKRIDAPETPDGAFCRLVISDNGIGFDEQYLEKIFTLFQRLNSKESYEGTGIGLAIAKKIVEKHNGLITARSKENEGATFIIVLPLKQEKEPESAEMALQLNNTENE
jgi:signal transduction histidine kinase/FixJ family two-component response regulator